MRQLTVNSEQLRETAFIVLKRKRPRPKSGRGLLRFKSLKNQPATLLTIHC